MHVQIKNKFFSRRLWILAGILFIGIVIYVSGIFTPTKVKIAIKRTSIVKSNYDFIYEHWREEGLKQLREKEDYGKINEPNQLKLFLKLCDWVHRQWDRSIPDPYPLSNGIDILKDIRAGKTGGFCGQYAYVLADVLKSLGFFNVRYVELWSNRGKNQSHFVIEVWSDRYEKWLILDPDYNIYYELKASGLPANALDIRQSLYGGEAVAARSVEPSQTVKENELTHLYANFAVSLRSDLLRHTKPLTIGDRFKMFLFFRDKNTSDFYPAGGIPYTHVTERKEDIYFDCNALRVEYAVDPDTKDINLTFYTDSSTPNFKGFSISKDLGKSWVELPGYRLRVIKCKEPVTLLVTPVNMYGRPGCMNRIDITF
ncbi:MAG: transglutaminase-like domain-containing protein [Acidobacteria bacterium]|jgi:hypothetical protein|nr:transglutaminase-like domain-containing protein [Acidobacteriota bacterium]